MGEKRHVRMRAAILVASLLLVALGGRSGDEMSTTEGLDTHPLDAFDFPEARTAALLSSISYCELNELRDNSCAGCKALGPKFEIMYANHGRADTQMLVARFKTPNWRRDPGDVILAFRGTQALQKLNWQLNLEHDRVPSMYEGIPGLLHKGFMTGFYVQLPALEKDNDARRRGQFSELMRLFKTARRIIVTGHSLGGAMASNAAAWLMSRPEIDNEKVWLYTFGAPRMGNKEFCEHMDSLGAGRMFRVVHGRDPVPNVPPRWFGYSHFGQTAWFSSGGVFTKEFLHSTVKRFLSLARVGDHSGYMGIHDACLADKIDWKGGLKDLSADGDGEEHLIFAPTSPPSEDDEQDQGGVIEEDEDDKGSWISRFFNWIRGFKEKWDYYDKIHDNLSKVNELFAKLLEQNPEYAEKVEQHLAKRRAELRRRRRMRHHRHRR